MKNCDFPSFLVCLPAIRNKPYTGIAARLEAPLLITLAEATPSAGDPKQCGGK